MFGTGVHRGGLRVSQTGRGLAPHDLPRAFDCFFLYDKQRRDRPVGSRLSLAIAKQLALRMGGDVSVMSRPGHGTQFIVSLRSVGEDPTVASDSRQGCHTGKVAPRPSSSAAVGTRR
jgi:signal transduction histidine kinase